MKIQDIHTPEHLRNYIEGVLNDFETGIVEKQKTINAFLHLIIAVSDTAKKGIPLSKYVKK